MSSQNSQHGAFNVPFSHYLYLTECKYDMAEFYILPKLHKSQYLSSILGHEQYIHLKDFCHNIDGRPIVGGPSFYTSGLSEMIDIILRPIVKMIPHIIRDSFDLYWCVLEKSSHPYKPFSLAQLVPSFSDWSLI